MFLITNQFGYPYYITGVEEVAKKYCADENAKQNLHVTGVAITVSYKEVLTLGVMNVNCNDLNPLIEAVPSCELDLAATSTYTTEQKHHILNVLGLSGRGKGLWYHKCLGNDTPFNRFNFNLADHNLSTILGLFYQKGYDRMRQQLIETFSSEA